MHHEYLDRYSRLDSVVHRMDPRFKFISAILFIAVISFSPNFYPLYVIMPVIVLSIVLSGVPFIFMLRRLAVCMPFLVFLLFLPPAKALLLCAKAASSITIMLLLISTTRFSCVLGTMRFLRVPNLFVMMFSFFYRYIFLFIETIHRMKQARDLRCFTRKQKLSPALVSNMAGGIIVRSYEQSERVYAAMLARGYHDTDN
ncbi:MAG: energy-coupling factor transporter transmembrane component T [archaeon]